MVKGAPDPLYSEFHLGYAMLLNLVRAEGADPEGLMSASYRQFQAQRALPQLQRQVEDLRQQHAAMAIDDEEQVPFCIAQSLPAPRLLRESVGRTLVHCGRCHHRESAPA